jgi:hypothetical protein
MKKNLGPFKDLQRELKQVRSTTINRKKEIVTNLPFLTWQAANFPAAFAQE